MSLSPELEEILKRIEELRQKLHELAETKGLADPEVIIASHMLDAVLNEYYRLLKQKKEE